MSGKVLISQLWEAPLKHLEALSHQIIRRFNQLNAEQIIAVVDILCIRKVWLPTYNEAMMDFMTEMWEILELTPSQLTRLAFHMVSQGGASPDFVLGLEQRFLELIHDLTLNEVAIICHSFFNCQYRIKSLKLLDKISDKLLKDLESLNFWYFAIFMKTFRFSNFLKVSFYHRLGDLLIEKDFLKKFNSLPQIMHITYTYASLRITHSRLFSYILRTCIESPGFKFRMKDVSKLVWSCGTLLVNEPHDLERICQIVSIAKDNLSPHEETEFPDNLVDLCIGLCYLNVYDDFFLNKIYSPECIPSLMRKYSVLKILFLFLWVNITIAIQQ